MVTKFSCIAGDASAFVSIKMIVRENAYKSKPKILHFFGSQESATKQRVSSRNHSESYEVVIDAKLMSSGPILLSNLSLTSL